jgi:hypothetical protein
MFSSPKAFFGGFRHDALVGFTVDHDLPFAGPDRLGARFQGPHGLALVAVQVFAGGIFLPNGQTPFLEQMHRVVHVTTKVENQVISGQTHKIVSDHLHVVFRSVFANVGIDGRKPLRNRTASFHGGFVNQENGCSAGPFLHLEGGAASGHTTTNDQYINFLFHDLWISNGEKLSSGFIRDCHIYILLTRS